VDTLKNIYRQTDFQRFCDQLEDLRGTVEVQEPSDEWLERMIVAVKKAA